MAKPKYKQVPRDTRRINYDGSFAKGVYYTTKLVDPGTSRMLLNYQVKDNGAYITPRFGLSIKENKPVKTFEFPFQDTDRVPGPHVKYYGVYRDSNNVDQFGEVLICFGTPSDNNYRYYMTEKQLLNPSYYQQTYVNKETAFGFIKDKNDKWHPLDVGALDQTRLRFYNYTPKPLYDVFQNKLYTIDGIADTEVVMEERTYSGAYPRLSNYTEYSGTLTSLTIQGVPTSAEPVPRFTINIVDANGTIKATHDTNSFLRSTPNGVYDQYDAHTGRLTSRIAEISLKGVAWTRTSLTNVDLIKIKKPTDSRMYNSVSGAVYQTSRMTDVNEVNVVYADIDSQSNIGSYTTRASITDIIYVVTKGTTTAVINSLLEDRSLTYVLTNPTVVRVPNYSGNLNVYEGGSVDFVLPATATFPRANYTLTYKMPVYRYLGGIQVNEIIETGGVFRLIPTKIQAKAPAISEATSVGFNMLLPNPYAFANSKGLTLEPQGIMPYVPGSNKQILMSANLGETIEFECIYRYTDGTKFFTKWEYLSSTSNTPIVISDYEDTPNVAGVRIFKLIKADDPKFSLRVTFVPEKADKPGEKDLRLSKVVVFPTYTAGDSYMRDISAYKYDLHNATGIGHYRTMLCLWGVPGADTTLFFSDIDDPSYFPFANNIIAFDHKILGVQSYQGGLLVFTTNSIYLVEGIMPSEFTVTEMYQSLQFDKEDMESLCVIKDMIFIRSGEDYYMMVPNTYTGDTVNLKLTTLSKPIKELTSNWKQFIYFLSTDVFGWSLGWDKDTKVEQYDFVNFIDNNKIKNIYRFAVYEDNVVLKRYQIDIILVFDTTVNVWTVEYINLPFNEFVVSNGEFYCTYIQNQVSKSQLFLEQLGYSGKSREDFYNTTSFDTAINDKHTSARETWLQTLPAVMTDTVVRVIDGDTVELAQLGSTRFLYVNAPENTSVVEDYGPEATELMRDLLPVGSTVTVEFEGERSDKYDRTLAWIKADDGRLAQMVLAQAGYVKSVYAYGQIKYASVLDAAISQAVIDKVGIWKYTEGSPAYIYTNKTEDLLLNYQVLDTGNRNQDPYLEKKYREFQMQIANESDANLQFYLRHYLEAVPRQDFRRYEIHHDTDRNSPSYGIMTVVPIDESNITVATATYLDVWQLDVNMFPDLEFVKVRYKLSGKGKYTRILIISKNQKAYNILSYMWVCRPMNYR